MRIEALAKIDVSQNTGATARLFDFCEHLAAANQVRVWLQRKPVPAALRSTPGIEVRFLPAPTPPDSRDALKALKAAAYEVLLAAQMTGTFVRRGRTDAIYMREVATVAPTVGGRAPIRARRGRARPGTATPSRTGGRATGRRPCRPTRAPRAHGVAGPGRR